MGPMTHIYVYLTWSEQPTRILADFYNAPQFEMIIFANVNIEHYNSDPVISLFGNMQIMFQYMEYDVTCIN